MAVQHHQSGRLQAAEQIYRQILAVEPNQADALHLLGVIAHQTGRHEVAVEYIGRAITLARRMRLSSTTTWGKPIRPCAGFPKRLPATGVPWNCKPDYAGTHNNLGNALKEQGQAGRSGRLLPPGPGAETGLCRGTLQPRATCGGTRESWTDAVDCYRRALERSRTTPRRTATWAIP